MYPADYGFVDDTLGEDGDPLDALVILEEPTFPGCRVRARPVGVFWMNDDAGPDAKIICVPHGDPRWDHVQDIEELPGLPAPTRSSTSSRSTSSSSPASSPARAATKASKRPGGRWRNRSNGRSAAPVPHEPPAASLVDRSLATCRRGHNRTARPTPGDRTHPPPHRSHCGTSVSIPRTDAAHLLRRAGFGATKPAIDRLSQAASWAAAVDIVCDTSRDPAMLAPSTLLDTG